MTTEQAVVPGRETYGEPKKIAEIDFQKEGDAVSARRSRAWECPTWKLAKAPLGKSLGPREFTEHAYCYKALPVLRAGQGPSTGDPLLVRLEWRHHASRPPGTASTAR